MRPLSVLLVEDNPGDVALMRAALKKSEVPVELTVANSATEALDVFYRRNGNETALPVDLALFDINMPGMSGLELLHEVKSDPDLKHTPVIMMTSSEAPADIKTAYREHANCYVTKPTDVTDLMSRVRTIEEFWFSLARLPRHANG